MYGTVAHLKPKPGQEQALIEYFENWDRERQPQVRGALHSYLYRLDKDPRTLVAAVVFQDKESYLANARSPEMDADFQRMRALLEADPVWEDGEIVASS